MKPIWKGSISFGLVNIPITLFPATKREELKFHLLRAKDLSPINYKRVAEADGKEVPWDQIVKGYEHEKGKYVVLKDEDFRRIDVEAAQTVVIESFVKLSEVKDLDKIIEQKIKAGAKSLPPAPKTTRTSGKIIDLLSVLQESVDSATKRKKGAKPEARASRKPRKAG